MKISSTCRCAQNGRGFPHNSWLMLAVSGGVGLVIGASVLIVASSGVVEMMSRPQKYMRYLLVKISAPPQRLRFAAIVAMCIIIFFGGFGSDNFDSLSHNQFARMILAAAFATLSILIALPFVVASTGKSPDSAQTTDPVSSVILWAIRAALIAWLFSATIDFPHQTPGAITTLAALMAMMIPQQKYPSQHRTKRLDEAQSAHLSTTCRCRTLWPWRYFCHATSSFLE